MRRAFTGAWIETSPPPGYAGMICRAFTGAWIETSRAGEAA